MPDGGELPKRGSIHPDHEELTRELRSWFTSSAPEIGYQVRHLWFGYLSEPGGHMGGRLILDLDKSDQVRAAVGEATQACGGAKLTVWVDDRQRAANLDAALRDCGCQPGKATVHLALVGGPPRRTGPAELVVENVEESGLAQWAAVKLQCFGDTESVPAADRLEAELGIRRAEMALAQYRLARLHDEPVAVLAYYPGRDQLVFNLGTRLPYRHRGIAQAMLSGWVDAGIAEGCRSMIINADDPGRPAELYRRLGFVDEIYWYQSYVLHHQAPQA
ncbi:MAG: GNAT family N-acetyltransferase [Acidimicrobiales bacterium]